METKLFFILEKLGQEDTITHIVEAYTKVEAINICQAVENDILECKELVKTGKLNIIF